ncbi:MAG: 4-hydroxythreonine-4-phosphate dehydrogenase PdxA [Bacteroidota bacterium]|nr:4-hydroxythreonine-4-phosphate dehydrogenase PdxA [Bacteroidota bacterium]
MEKHHPVIGVTIGDINGIGPEVILKTFADHAMLHFCTPVIYGSTKMLNYYRNLLHLEDHGLIHIPSISQIAHKKVNVIHCWDNEVLATPGKASEVAGNCAFLSLQKCTNDLKNGHLNAMVTAPIDKNTIKNPQFNFVGHTEYLQHIFQAKEVLMFMVSEQLKVALVTEHVPVNQISTALTKEKLIAKIKLVMSSLKKDYNIVKPKIAVLGLNPHAGDKGVIGNEEEQIIKPVIQSFRDNGEIVIGPFPADGFFASDQMQKFDAVLAMYHDQGLIPFKMLAFSTGVNFTAGLPVVRTSPDHGTAYDIAGKGVADENSFRQAVFTALDIIKNRAESSNKREHTAIVLESEK